MRYFVCGVLALSLLGVAAAVEGTAGKPNPEAVARTRDQVKMLDDLYKTAVVFITDKYVHATTDISAGTAAVTLFDVMDKKGWHRVRILDATGDPYDAKNVAQDDFEKRAIEQLKSGKAFVEQVESAEGKNYFRAMTPIPVVMEKCTMCHPHYADVPKGQIIGALSYRLEIK